MFGQANVFVFTLGLTEGWSLIDDGTMFPIAPGIRAGNFDQKKYQFCNLTYQEIYNDLVEFRDYLKGVNPEIKLLLTVSPVP